VAAAGDEVAPLWKSQGLDPRPYGGSYDHLYLDIYPPELDSGPAPHVTRRQLLRPVTDDGHQSTASSPPFPDVPTGARRVYASMGTVFNDPDLVRVILAALGELDVAALMTVGHQTEPGIFGSRPPNVRIERYVPQGADQFLNGISLSPGEATADAVGDAVVRLLEDASFAHAAGRVAQSIESMPAPDDVVTVLEALA
jgi:UDP:flavonoid glycosyltransferase YjiC (YdhE family)